MAEPENHSVQSLLKLSKAWNRLFSSGEHSDVDIFARDEEKITAHSLVLHVRCPKLLQTGIYENDKKVISISEVSAYVLKSFLKLLYTGKLVMSLRNEQDVLDAKYLAKNYPQVDEWKVFVDNLNNPNLAGFLDGQENSIEDVASQNLSGLLDILEGEVIDKSDNEDDDNEWSEMCEILQSQKSSSIVKCSSENSAMNSRSESPDLFDLSDQDDKDNEEIKEKTETSMPLQRSLKRKSILDDSANVSNLEQSPELKKSRLDFSFEFEQLDTENNFKEFEQYSRQNVSTPTLSIMEEVEDDKEDLKVTPIMPHYESMLSPALQQELQKFGLKVIPRQKAVPLLRHIYEETHPGQFCSR